jgi:hypothetical protein
MQERRTSERVRADLTVRWETLKAQGRGSFCDLSSSGCFVLTGGEVNAGDLIRLELALNDDIAMLWGHVIYSVSEMGFAIRFVCESEEETSLPDRLIAGLR